MTHHPPIFPPDQQWPVPVAPDCPTCARPTGVTWIGNATTNGGADLSVWHCRTCPTTWTIPATHWPVLDGPDCPYCYTAVTCWAALDPDHAADLWTCEHGHEFILTPEGMIILPEDVA
jgi:hypothetical protein